MTTQSNTSDWPVWRHDSARTGFNSAEQELRPPLKLIWKRADAIGAQVVASNGLVFGLGGTDRIQLRAVNGANGTVRWTDRSQAAFPHRIAVRGGRVFAAANFEGTWALDNTDGDLEWFRAVWANDLGFVDGTLTNGYYGMSESTGETQWVLAWQCTGGGGDPYAVAGRTFYASDFLGLQACDIGDLEPKWLVEKPQGSTLGWPAVDGGRVFVIGSIDPNTGFLLSVEAATGADAKMFSINSMVGLETSPAVAYDRVYFGADDGIVRALNADSLSLSWQRPLLAAVRAGPVVANGVVYVTTGFESASRLYALDAATGATLWEYRLSGTLRTTSPIIADGRLYLVDRFDCGRCTLYAFGSTASGPSQPPQESAKALAVRFSPALVLMNGTLCKTGVFNGRLDPYAPESVEAMAPVSRLMRSGLAGDVVVSRPLPSIDVLGEYGGKESTKLFLDVEGLSPYMNNACRRYADLYRTLLQRFRNVTYATVEAYGSGSTFRVVVTYRFFYFFNDWDNNHEGDWEHIRLTFTSTPSCTFGSLPTLVRKGCVPSSATYSQHALLPYFRLVTKPWTYVAKRDATHPLVFVGSGSHASYFRPGRYQATPDWAPRDPKQPDLGDPRAAFGRVIMPSVSIVDCSAPPPWWQFKGLWGEKLKRRFSSGPTLTPLCGASAKPALADE